MQARHKSAVIKQHEPLLAGPKSSAHASKQVHDALKAVIHAAVAVDKPGALHLARKLIQHAHRAYKARHEMAQAPIVHAITAMQEKYGHPRGGAIFGGELNEMLGGGIMSDLLDKVKAVAAVGKAKFQQYAPIVRDVYQKGKAIYQKGKSLVDAIRSSQTGPAQFAATGSAVFGGRPRLHPMSHNARLVRGAAVFGGDGGAVFGGDGGAVFGGDGGAVFGGDGGAVFGGAGRRIIGGPKGVYHGTMQGGDGGAVFGGARRRAPSRRHKRAVQRVATHAHYL